MHFPTTEKPLEKPLNIAIVASSFYTVRSTENYELELVKNALSTLYDVDVKYLHKHTEEHLGEEISFESKIQDFKINNNINNVNVTLIIVPGAMEIPQACKWLIGKGNIDGILALGCVIRGETTHYDHVCHTAISGISQIALQTKVPIINAIVTAENDKTAKERCFAEIDGKPAKNLGFHGMNALIDMIKLKNSL